MRVTVSVSVSEIEQEAIGAGLTATREQIENEFRTVLNNHPQDVVEEYRRERGEVT